MKFTMEEILVVIGLVRCVSKKNSIITGGSNA